MSDDLAKKIAKGALRIEWKDTESAARRVAEHAADRIEELEAKLSKSEALLAKAVDVGNKMAKSIEGNYYIPSVAKEWRTTLAELTKERSDEKGQDDD